MYNINKRRKLKEVSVSDLIEELKQLPQDAKVVFCGDYVGFIHVERDDSVVCIDTEDLDEDYEDDPETSPEDFWANKERLGN